VGELGLESVPLGRGSFFVGGRAANEKPRRHPCRRAGAKLLSRANPTRVGARRQSHAVSRPVAALALKDGRRIVSKLAVIEWVLGRGAAEMTESP